MGSGWCVLRVLASPGVFNKSFILRRRIARFESNFIIGRRFYGSTMAPIVPPSGEPATIVASCIKDNKIMIFSKSYCPFCNRVKELFKQIGVEYSAIELDLMENGADVQAELINKSGQRT